MIAGPAVTVWGESVGPADAGEEMTEAVEDWARGVFLARHFSVECPEGELGLQEVAQVQEISQAEFESARSRGWRSAIRS